MQPTSSPLARLAPASRRTPARALTTALLSAAGLTLSGALAFAAPGPAFDPREAETTPQELTGIEISDRRGAAIPKELVLRDSAGRDVKLEKYLDGERPVVLVLAYYSCPMLCTLVLNGVVDGLKEVALTAGKDFKVLAVSIDPRDTAEVAAAKRANYVEAYGREVTTDGFDFLTGDEATVRRLADAVGFAYRWDEESKQYAHAAGAFILTPKGTLSQTLYGIAFPEAVLRLALVEAADGAIGSAVDKITLFCFQYDPKTGGYVLAASRLMSATGALMVLAVGVWLAVLWRRELPARATIKEA